MDHDTRVCIYPCYINSNCGASEGRKIPKSLACEDPTTQQIFDCVVQGLKLAADIERKRHPRDWKYLGRVRVQLKNESGKPINPEIPNRRALMVKLAELVPRHPGRSGKTKAITSGGGSSAAASGGSSGKKGGKKKK